jgi:hypothetical protein
MIRRKLHFASHQQAIVTERAIVLPELLQEKRRYWF